MYLILRTTAGDARELRQHRAGPDLDAVGQHAAAGDHCAGADDHAVAHHRAVDRHIVLDHRTWFDTHIGQKGEREGSSKATKLHWETERSRKGQQAAEEPKTWHTIDINHAVAI